MFTTYLSHFTVTQKLIFLSPAATEAIVWTLTSTCFKLFYKWAIPGNFFLYFRLSNTYFIHCWWLMTRTADLWDLKRLLYQLSHSNCPRVLICTFSHSCFYVIKTSQEGHDSILRSRVGLHIKMLIFINSTKVFRTTFKVKVLSRIKRLIFNSQTDYEPFK